MGGLTWLKRRLWASTSRRTSGLLLAPPTISFQDYKYVVRQSEEQAYLDAGITPDHLWAVPDHLICGLTEVNQFLIDSAPEDVIAILDDDIHHFYYLMEKLVPGGRS